jgi:hypothetical protein
MTKSIQERFDEKYIGEPMSGCWLWMGATFNVTKNQLLYGSMRFRGKAHGAHRVSWNLHKGEIPPGIDVLHRCDLPLCVNPDHLFLGTHSENMQDAVRKGRKNMPRGESHFRSKLTDEIVRQIRSSKNNTAWWVSHLGVSEDTIRRARNRETWKHA